LTNAPFSLRAKVIHGNHLGRTLGFPTANLELLDNRGSSLPFGVYAVRATVDDFCYNGMANAGLRPTIAGSSLTVEVHLFDFSGDLYAKTLEVQFIHKIRDEKKFDNIELLVQQIRQDEITARNLLA